jgi:hypothetical protein
MLVPAKLQDLLEIKNYAINAGIPLSILKPGDGKRVSCLSGSLFINQYGKVKIDMNGRCLWNFFFLGRKRTSNGVYYTIKVKMTPRE